MDFSFFIIDKNIWAILAWFHYIYANMQIEGARMTNILEGPT